MRMKYKHELEKIGRTLCTGTDFIFVIDNEIELFQGGTTTDLDDVKQRYLRIGVSGGRLLSNKQQFVVGLVCLYHEYRHVEHFEAMRSGCISRENRDSFLSCQCNNNFYEDNYKNMLHEIDAEHHGVIGAYRYLTEHGSESDAWQSIKDYIDIKLKQGDVRYVNRGFENCQVIEDVDNNFDRVYEEAKSAECNLLAIKRSLNSIIDPEQADFSDQLVYKLLYENKDANDIMCLLPSGTEQIKFMASYVLHKHPDYRLFFGNSDIMSLRYENYINAYENLLHKDGFDYMSRSDKRSEYMKSLNTLVSHNRNDIETNVDCLSSCDDFSNNFSP